MASTTETAPAVAGNDCARGPRHHTTLGACDAVPEVYPQLVRRALMMLATVDGALSPPAPGAIGHCPACHGPAVAKCGQIITHHWAHEARADCDPWAEPESEWHQAWKRRYLQHGAQIEAVIGNHRADILLPTGVIELQHSPIGTTEAREREAFYGRMLWLFDMTDPERFDRVHHGKRGLWWKHGSRTQARLGRPLYWHTPDRQVWHVALSEVDPDKGTRVLGKVIAKHTEAAFLDLTITGGRR